MKFILSVVAAMAALAEAACPAGSLTGGTAGTAGCICPSGQSGVGSCAPYPVTGVCPGDALPKASNTTTSLANMQLTTINMTGTDTLVRFTISIPMMAGRNYTSVGVTGPSFNAIESGCDAATVFTDFATIAASANCVENWNITAVFDSLRTCGFAISDQNNLTLGYQLYDGNIRVGFNEPVEVGTGNFAQNVTRSVTVDYPVRIAFDSNYVVPMTVNDVTVYAKQQIDFAITGQNIPKDPLDNGMPSATITYTVQYPYAVTGWGSITSTQTDITALVNGVANPVTAGATNAPTTVCDATATNPVQYAVSDTAATSTCRKSDNTLMFTTSAGTAAQCKFTNYAYTLAFNVRCGVGIAAADCPLAAADTSGTVTFSVTSENFCTAQAATDNINGVISITSFKAVAVTNYATQQNAWRWGDTIFMRMDFAGLPLRTCHLTKLERRYQSTTITSVADGDWVEVGTAGTVSTTNGNATTSITLTGFADTGAIPATPQANVAPTVATGNLGLQDAGTEYRFVLLANAALTGSADGPVRGADEFLKLRATIDVTYDRPLGRRRRQVAAGAGGTGVKESETQSISYTDAAAATPDNSAVRAAPAVALVLAILSAVALL